MEGAHPTPEWRSSRHVDLPIFSFFVLCSFPFLFWHPFSNSGGRAPKPPQDTPLHKSNIEQLLHLWHSCIQATQYLMVETYSLSHVCSVLNIVRLVSVSCGGSSGDVG